MIMEKENLSELSGRKYWKSLDDLSGDPAFQSWVANEFPEGASLMEGVERRGFLKVMAASFGLAGFGLTGCRRPEHTILPYGKSPEELIPGVPNYYATSMPTPGGFAPLIAESHQGRPTKVEGNPSYALSGGSTDVYSQASLLDLYDPDRAKGSFVREELKSGSGSSVRWRKIPSKDAIERIRTWSSSGKFAIISDSSSSLIRNELIADLKSSGVRHVVHEPIDFRKPEQDLGRALSSEGLRVVPNLAKAKRVLSLDSDFLGTREPNSIVNSRQFMEGRRVLHASEGNKMNRLYSVESDLTLTGGVADHRLRLSSSSVPSFAALVLLEVLKLKDAKDEQLFAHLSKMGASLEAHRSWIGECASDLVKSGKNSAVLIGSHLPASAQLLGYAINHALGNVGTCINYASTSEGISYTLDELAKDLEDGKVESVLVLGGNPAFTGSNLGIKAILEKAKNSAHLGPFVDETSDLCDLHIGQSHYLESWDVGLTWDLSSIVPTQPLIAPLFDTLSDVEALASLSGNSASSHELASSGYEKASDAGKSFADFLRLGGSKNKRTWLNKPLDHRSQVLALEPSSQPPSFDSLEVLLTPDFHTWDGRYGNNGWMLECPDPISKLTWDNAVLISPALAKRLESQYPRLALLPKPTMLNENGQIASDNAVYDGGKQKAPVVKISIGDHHEITAPLYVLPGLADFTLVASLGMGRSKVGRVGEGSGYDSFSLLHSDGSRILSGATLVPTGEFKILANVQEHWSMEGRAIVREANLSEYQSDPGFAAHMGAESHSPPIYGKDAGEDLVFKSQTTPRGNSSYDHPDHTYENSEVFGLHQWGMSIDLNQCTGCSACVVACQSENNIPVVGKDQVLRGREMHWIRLDRYFSSPAGSGPDLPSDVQVSFQGVACMHCETAPCESVCPVNATVHDEEGLNAMAYNRCVGTRYCANNCPYKVRRFNFFDWNKRKNDELYQGPLGSTNDSLPAMGKNPDVTVRMRGVMEKCTYCTQRIQESKIRTKVEAQRNASLKSGKDGKDLVLEPEDLKVRDGAIKTACQQVCPTDAIVFGDISDPDSEVSKLKNNPRDYSVLGYLSTRPRTTFLAKVRNPNPRMPDHFASPHSTREYHDKAHPSHHGDVHDGGAH